MIDQKHSQDAFFTVRGQWWLPGSDRRVAGDLIYQEEDISLVLYGGLNDAKFDSPFSATPEVTEFPVIHGESLQSVPVTLLRSFYTKWSPDIRRLGVRPDEHTQILSSELHCHAIVVGAHLSTADDCFDKCRIEIPALETWLGDKPFEVDIGNGFDRVHVNYTRPLDDAFELSTCRLRVRFIRSVKPPGFPGYSPSIDHRAFVEVEPFEPMSVNCLRDHAGEVTDLFSFLYGGDLVSRRLWLFNKGSEIDKVALYYCRHPVAVADYGALDLLLRLDDVRPIFGSVLENWFTAATSTKRARRILLSTERRPAGFIELRFLPLVHAAEILARASKHSTIVASETFDDIRTRLLGSLPGDAPRELVESIKNGLGHANGRSLKHTLQKMLSDLREETCRLFCVDQIEFIKGIVNTRNHYTHYSSKDKQKFLQGSELHWAIRKLSSMLRILLLLKAGIPEVDLESKLRSHHRSSRERAVWRNVTEEGSPFDADEPT